MDKELLKVQINKAQRDLTAASLWLNDAVANYHYKRGQLAALQWVQSVIDGKTEKYIESNN